MDISAQMLIFVSVVEQGSISAAARSIGQTPSAVSKQIALLEDHVNRRLLNRTRRGVSPTQEGQEFYEKCRDMAEKFREAQALIGDLDDTPRGVLRVAATVAFGKSQLIPALPRFIERFPELRVSLDLTDRAIDLQTEGFDAAISFSEQRQNPDTVARKIMQSRRVLCAAPAYLERFGTPTSAEDLARHSCLRLSGNPDRNFWSGLAPAADPPFEAQGAFEGNSTDVIYRAALAGLGIARLPCYMAGRKFESGELVRVLPDYAAQTTEIFVMFAERRNLAPRTRAFVDFVTEQFKQGPEDIKSARSA